MDTLDAIPAFLAVLDEGTIQGAAARLGISRPTVRKRLDDLEASIGAPLLYRSESGFRPTESGRVYAVRARQMLQELEVLARSGPAPGGVLRIGLPTGSPAPIVIREQLVASRTYLDKHAPIHSVADLAGHSLLGWIAPDTGRPTRLPVADGVAPPVDFALCSDDPSALIWMAGRGDGLAWVPFVPELAAPPFLDVGPLVTALPDVVRRDRKRRLVVAEAVSQVPTMRSFLEATQLAIQNLTQ